MMPRKNPHKNPPGIPRLNEMNLATRPHTTMYAKYANARTTVGIMVLTLRVQFSLTISEKHPGVCLSVLIPVVVHVLDVVVILHEIKHLLKLLYGYDDN